MKPYEVCDLLQRNKNTQGLDMEQDCPWFDNYGILSSVLSLLLCILKFFIIIGFFKKMDKSAQVSLLDLWNT